MSKIWSWIKDKWNKFETWVASWAPGLKTKLASAAGAVGSGALVVQSYITGLPLDKFITGTQIAIVTAILFTLSFWFRHLTNVASESNS